LIRRLSGSETAIAKAGNAGTRIKGPIHCEVTVKGAPVADELELYNLTIDSVKLSNRYGGPACSRSRRRWWRSR